MSGHHHESLAALSSEHGVGIIELPGSNHLSVVFLGGLSNALAAAETGRLCGVPILHIICVASTKKALRVEDRVLKSKHSLSFRRFFMEDRLRCDEDRTLQHVAEPLTAIEDALKELDEKALRLVERERGGTAAAATPEAELSSPHCPSGVLVHCDKGHNRSPTLVLLALLRRSMTLRDAYRCVLRAKPSIDPLPSYRRLLRTEEASKNSTSSQPQLPSIHETDLFGMHISEVMSVSGSEVRRDPDGTSNFEGVGVDDQQFMDGMQNIESAIQRRQKSIDGLLEEAFIEASRVVTSQVELGSNGSGGAVGARTCCVT